MKSVERVRAALIESGVGDVIIELPASQSARTAQMAADALSRRLDLPVPVGAIVKSLVFLADRRPILALVAGDRRGDTHKLRLALGVSNVGIADAEAVRAATGFAIGVIDDRESFANAERFPMAREIHTSYEEAFAKLKPDKSSYLVIVTRGHRDDMRVLGWAVGTSARYIGMIGSKRKVLSVYKALEKEGIPVEKFARVHAPMGLDIGALTPEEIAISITAELIGIRRNATGLAHKAIQVPKASPTSAD